MSEYELRHPDGRIETGPQVDAKVKPDYGHACEVCGNSPVVPMTGMCGPCTFGEAETADGNW